MSIKHLSRVNVNGSDIDIRVDDHVKITTRDGSIVNGVITDIDSSVYYKDYVLKITERNTDIYTIPLFIITDYKIVTNGLTKQPTTNSMVNHPHHYQSEAGLEVIDVIEAFTAKLTGIEASDTANVIKYICRWKEKNGVQDLEKAKWYLEHLIDHVNKTEKEN